MFFLFFTLCFVYYSFGLHLLLALPLLLFVPYLVSFFACYCYCLMWCVIPCLTLLLFTMMCHPSSYVIYTIRCPSSCVVVTSPGSLPCVTHVHCDSSPYIIATCCDLSPYTTPTCCGVLFSPCTIATCYGLLLLALHCYFFVPHHFQVSPHPPLWCCYLLWFVTSIITLSLFVCRSDVLPPLLPDVNFETWSPKCHLKKIM